MFAEKAWFDVLCTCQATSFSKMAKLAWRYSDHTRTIIENVYKFYSGKEVWKETVTSSCMGQDCSTHRRYM